MIKTILTIFITNILIISVAQLPLPIEPQPSNSLIERQYHNGSSVKLPIPNQIQGISNFSTNYIDRFSCLIKQSIDLDDKILADLDINLINSLLVEKFEVDLLLCSNQRPIPGGKEVRSTYLFARINQQSAILLWANDFSLFARIGDGKLYHSSTTKTLISEQWDMPVEGAVSFVQKVEEVEEYKTFDRELDGEWEEIPNNNKEVTFKRIFHLYRLDENIEVINSLPLADYSWSGSDKPDTSDQLAYQLHDLDQIVIRKLSNLISINQEPWVGNFSLSIPAK